MAAAGVVLCSPAGLGLHLALHKGMLKEDDGRGRRLSPLGRNTAQMAPPVFPLCWARASVHWSNDGAVDGVIGSQALALMGISASTGIAAAVISMEKRQETAAAPALQAGLATHEQVLQAAVANPLNTSNVPVLAEQLKAVALERARLIGQQVTAVGSVLEREPVFGEIW